MSSNGPHRRTITVAGRVGLVAIHNQFLFYGKGGYASALVDVSATSATGVTAHQRRREDGWVIGGSSRAEVTGAHWDDYTVAAADGTATLSAAGRFL